MINAGSLLAPFERKEKTRRDELILLATLLIITALFRLPFLGSEPFVKDEALYAQMIDEFSAHPSMVPTFLGYEVGWRPFLFFAIYSPLVSLFSLLPLSTEFVYRLPSFLFAMGSVFVFYYLVKELYDNIDLAFLSALLFSISPLTVIINNTVLVDTLLLFFILISLLCYVRAHKRDARYFLAAGAFAFCAYMVKTVVAFAIPVIALAYFFFHAKKLLKHPLFLVSLLGIPLAILSYYLMFSDKSVILAEYMYNVTQKLVNDTPLLVRFINSIAPIIIVNGFFIGFYALGTLRMPKFDKHLLVWMSLIVFACLGGYLMPWYFLPIIPPFSIAAALIMLNSSLKLDRFSLLAIAFFLLTSLLLLPLILDYMKDAIGERAAGKYLIGKGNVLIAGDYAPSLLFYKLHGEQPPYSTFCWLINLDAKNRSDSSYLSEVVRSYSSLSENHTYNERITDIFWNLEQFKLPCNVSSFDYLALVRVPNETAAVLTEFQPIQSFDENITIYARRKTN